jgi:hypothetical protein
VTGSDPSPSLLAAFRGAVDCRRTAEALILTGAAADPADGRLILTLITASAADLAASLTDATVAALDEHRYRITCGSRSWVVEAASVHVHYDIGEAFYRAIPPRPAPLTKRLFWGAVLALAGTRAGKRLLLSVRRRA